jgi:Na+-transporting methylmalonyl-CoA/oxaloacetate decarboxylase gamma subunit
LSTVLFSSSSSVFDNSVASFLFSISALFIIASIIDLYLIYTKTKNRTFFYINTFLQLLPSAYVSVVIPIGIVFFVLNFLILATLVAMSVKERRSGQQLELEIRKPKNEKT